jgi:hypothetical protein
MHDHMATTSNNVGRPAIVCLLDERRININVQPRLHCSELAAIVASHCQLKSDEQVYFGLTYVDDW